MSGEARNVQPLIIDVMIPSDWDDVASIYLQGIAGENATFETRAPDWETWDRTHLRMPRLVARAGEELAGWAALSPVSSRAVYAGVAEVSVYVASEQQGRGVGARLLEQLIRESESAGLWTLQAGIFPENVASIRLHEKNGFRVVGTREKIGRFHDGRWRDVVLLERRSRVTGVD